MSTRATGDLLRIPAALRHDVEQIAEACCGWSDAQRRSIWHETDRGMTDDDDDDALCDTSFNGIGYALQAE